MSEIGGKNMLHDTDCVTNSKFSINEINPLIDFHNEKSYHEQTTFKLLNEYLDTHFQVKESTSSFKLKKDNLRFTFISREAKHQHLSQKPSPINQIDSSVQSHIIDQSMALCLEEFNYASNIYTMSRSNIYSLLSLSIVEDEIHNIIGVLFFHFNPIIGLFIPFLVIKESYRGKGLGENLLILLQRSFYHHTKSLSVLAWLGLKPLLITMEEDEKRKRNASNDRLIVFYRRLGFYPVHPANYALPYLFQNQILEEISTVDIEKNQYAWSFHI